MMKTNKRPLTLSYKIKKTFTKADQKSGGSCVKVRVKFWMGVRDFIQGVYIIINAMAMLMEAGYKWH